MMCARRRLCVSVWEGKGVECPSGIVPHLISCVHAWAHACMRNLSSEMRCSVLGGRLDNTVHATTAYLHIGARLSCLLNWRRILSCTANKARPTNASPLQNTHNETCQKVALQARVWIHFGNDWKMLCSRQYTMLCAWPARMKRGKERFLHSIYNKWNYAVIYECGLATIIFVLDIHL